jgi:hypothetical protein
LYFRVEQNATGTIAEIATASTSAIAQALYDNYSVAADVQPLHLLRNALFR